ncbi:MAG: hypothetical protein ABIP48_17315 [Planctomycetota bacterium]
MTTSINARRFYFGQTVIVHRPDGEHVGVVFGTEPGEHRRRPIAGLAYHVRMAGIDGERGLGVVVGEQQLSGLTESDKPPGARLDSQNERFSEPHQRFTHSAASSTRRARKPKTGG